MKSWRDYVGGLFYVLFYVTFLGRGDGTFDTGPVYPLSYGGVFTLTAADLNLDGSPEVIVARDDSGYDDRRFTRLLILEIGDGDVFESPISIYIGKPVTGIAVGDMDGDGRSDFVLRDLGSTDVYQQVNVLLQR